MTSIRPTLETSLQRRQFRWLWEGSLAVTVLVFALLILRDGPGVIGRFFAVAVSAQLVGKWLIFVGARATNPYGFSAWELATLISVLDLWLGMALCTFLPKLEGVPRLGPWIVTTRIKAQTAFLEYPRLRRMAFWGAALWVMLPLPASGAITGSFATRLVGLSRVGAVGAIVVGSVANGAVFAAMASWLGANSEALLNNRAVTAVCSVALLAAIWAGWRRLRRALREA